MDGPYCTLELYQNTTIGRYSTASLMLVLKRLVESGMYKPELQIVDEDCSVKLQDACKDTLNDRE